MTADCARQMVFQTVELLENILKHVTSQQLFAIQRVSIQFRAVIAQSACLQMQMFLRPDLRSIRSESYDAQRCTPLEKLHRDDKEMENARLAAGHESLPGPTRKLAILNSITMRLSDEGLKKVRGPTMLSKGLCSNQHASLRLQCLLRDSQSWRRMYLTSPPITAAHVQLHWKVDRGIEGFILGEFADPAGITFQSAVTAMLEQSSTTGTYSRILLPTVAKMRLELGNPTMGELIAKFEAGHGCQATIVASTTFFELHDVVPVVNLSEWLTVS